MIARASRPSGSSVEDSELLRIIRPHMVEAVQSRQGPDLLVVGIEPRGAGELDDLAGVERRPVLDGGYGRGSAGRPAPTSRAPRGGAELVTPPGPVLQPRRRADAGDSRRGRRRRLTSRARQLSASIGSPGPTAPRSAPAPGAGRPGRRRCPRPVPAARWPGGPSVAQRRGVQARAAHRVIGGHHRADHRVPGQCVQPPRGAGRPRDGAGTRAASRAASATRSRPPSAAASRFPPGPTAPVAQRGPAAPSRAAVSRSAPAGPAQLKVPGQGGAGLQRSARRG